MKIEQFQKVQESIANVCNNIYYVSYLDIINKYNHNHIYYDIETNRFKNVNDIIDKIKDDLEFHNDKEIAFTNGFFEIHIDDNKYQSLYGCDAILQFNYSYICLSNEDKLKKSIKLYQYKDTFNNKTLLFDSLSN